MVPARERTWKKVQELHSGPSPIFLDWRPGSHAAGLLNRAGLRRREKLPSFISSVTAIPGEHYDFNKNFIKKGNCASMLDRTLFIYGYVRQG